MKLFRINNVKEFFDSFPKATTILNQAEREFSNNVEVTMKKINVAPQINFSGEIVPILITLRRIEFSGDHELYYYEITYEE
jgi:hypothetical protein